MKKNSCTSGLLLVLAMLTVPLSGQSQNTYITETDHFKIQSEVSPLHAAETGARMEAMFEFFNGYFRFDVTDLHTKLQVKIFARKEKFDEYIYSVIKQKRDDFVYIHYQNPEKCLLTGFFDASDPHESSLIHQSFIQYLKAFISEPPLWLREGFAVYFEKVKYNKEAGSIVFRDNTTWLDTVKTLVKDSPGKLIPPDRMLTMDLENARKEIDVFYPQTWAMIDFMMGTPEKQYSRALWDSVRFLKADAAIQENIDRLNKFVFSWISKEEVSKAFVSYFSSRHSFRELMQEGSELYSKGDYDGAEARFLKAVSVEEGQDLPYYYLGLVSYEKKDYPMAEYYYRTALQMGSNPGLVFYALGINAYAAKNRTAAKEYLIKARDEGSGEYRKKAEEVLAELSR